MSVSAIVVTYNRLNKLKKCIHNLLTQSYKLDNIFIVNNNSNDGTEEYLSTLNNNIVKPINTHKNLGGAGGFSIGTKIAYERSTSKYFWLMDDDALPLKSSLDKLVKSASKLNGKFGFLCSNVRWWKDDRTLNIPIPSKDWDKFLPGNIVKVIKASFVSFFVSRNVVGKLGLPLAPMFIWGDDYEYTTRISNMYPSYYVLDSIVIHNSNVSNGKETVFNTTRIKYYFYLYRNILFTMRKYKGFKKTVRQFLLDLSEAVEIPFISKNHRFVRLAYVLWGIVDGLLFFNPRIKFPK